MNVRTLSLLLALPALSAHAAEQMSAVAACKALSKTQQRMVTRLSAHAGKPSPETWTILVHDAKTPFGFRECTVASGTVVASRLKSDLINNEPKAISAADVVGLDNLKIDSDQVAELVAGYAEANQMQPAAFDYDLHKEGDNAAPLWTVTAFNDAGAKLGTIVLAANTGALVSHDGFAQVPATPDLTTDIASAEPAKTDTAADEPTDKEPENKSKASTSSSSKKRAASSDSDSDSGERKRPNTFRRIGGHLQKFFTGKNTIGR